MKRAGVRKFYTMTSSQNNSIEKLKGRENFDEWKIAAQSYLVIKGLWRYMIAETTSSDTAVLESDLKAKSELTLLIEPQNYSFVADKPTAKAAWDSLVGAFEDSGTCRKVSLLQQLVSTKLQNCSSMETYVNKMLLLSIKVKKAGFVVNDDIIASLMLGGLSSEYRPLVMGIENSVKNLTVDYVKNILLQEVSVETNDSAFFTKNSNKKRKKFNNPGRCFECNATDHIAIKCPKKKNSKNGNKKGASEKALIATTFFVEERNLNDWYFDSGTTSHMTNDESILENRSNILEREVITANNTKMFVKSVGDVNQNIVLDNELDSLKIKDVQYIPDVVANLLSVSKIVENDNTVIFNKHGCKVLNADQEVIATGSIVNKMFKLDTISKSNEIACIGKQQANNALLWHKRLGHLNYQSMCQMRDGAVNGINFKNATNILKNCEICAKGKHARQPFKNSVNNSKQTLDLIHSDLCGAMETDSIGGAKYFLTFIDDFSRQVFIYFLKNKSEVLPKFIEFIAWAENQHERKIKVFRTDNGTEFCSKNIEDICKKYGIQHQRTVVYTPQQNGVAERMNRTIVEKAKCMLFESNLDKSYWAEATNMAVYIINRSVCSFLSDKTPEEVWTGNKADLSQLKIFGSPTMVHIPKAKRKKWDAKSTKLIFVGYDKDRKGYRCMDPIKKKVTVSRDVIFMENEVGKAITTSGDEFRFFPLIDEVEALMEDNDVDIDSTIIDSTLIDLTSPNNTGLGSPILSVHLETTVDPDNSSLHSETTMNPNDSSVHSETTMNHDNSSDYFDTTLDTTLDDTNADPNYHTRANMNNIPASSPKTRKQFRKLNLNNENSNFALLTSDPSTLKEALNDDHASKWKLAISEEYNSLIENNTWNLVTLPPGKKPIKCKWVFKSKTDNIGNVVRHKARLVAKGCSQKFGIDYTETFSPVVRYCSIRYLISIAAQYDLDILQMDVVTAFLQGDLFDKIYMVQPDLYHDGTDKVCELNKPIYGLKQASHEWNKKLSSVLKTAGYKQSKLDPCIYFLIDGIHMIFLAIYVDDLMIFTNNMDMQNKLKSTLMEKFKMQDVGVAKYCIGIHITRDKTAGNISMDQEGYINQMLNRFGMEDCNPVSTPMNVSIKLTKAMSPTTEEEREEMVNIPFQEAVGSILYLAQGTRPDIAYAINNISRFNNNPGKLHWLAIKHLFRYLKGTSAAKLTFSKKENSQLLGYSDADWGSDVDDRRSCTGHVFIKNGGSVSWQSKRQQTIALSSTEAEYMALSSSTQEALWLRQLQWEFWQDTKPTPILCDNQSTICLAKNDAFQPRSKHIDIKHHFVREKVENKQISISHVSTTTMVADVLTKALPKQKHNWCFTKMGLQL